MKNMQPPLTWVEISRSAFNYNISAFRKRIGKKVLLMPVIKSNAYGHDIVLIGKLCEANADVDRICVVSLDEALLLRKNGITKPIVILAIYSFEERKIAEAVRKKIIFPLYTREQAKLIHTVAKRLHTKALVHLKVDIGTSRIGVPVAELPVFLKDIKTCSHLIFDGVFGHFASSEDDAERTNKQNSTFQKALTILKTAGLSVPVQHVACSASTTLHAKTHYNAVRVGLGVYGLDPSGASRKKIELKPILQWFTTILQTKTVPAGTQVSYGGTYTTKQKTTLATLPVGYFDGYDRGFSNNSVVLVRGKRCPVRGRVCMNLSIIDITGVPNVKAGDTVVLLGTNKKVNVSADELAKNINTINYEIVTRINQNIPRLVV